MFKLRQLFTLLVGIVPICLCFCPVSGELFNKPSRTLHIFLFYCWQASGGSTKYQGATVVEMASLPRFMHLFRAHYGSRAYLFATLNANKITWVVYSYFLENEGTT